MEPDLAPEEIRQAKFRNALRGLDHTEVMAFLDRVATEMEKLIEARDQLSAQVGGESLRDLRSEIDEAGREVASVLQTAREAAESMRERAGLDASEWRSEARREADSLIRDAKSDAEALRRDAWVTGTDLLQQTMAEIRQMREEADQEILTVMGGAEREAHRLTSIARRDAEDVVRAATMEAERLATESTKDHDELIERAHRATESAQERTRALEERREELLEELEHARATLTRLEETLEERREHLGMSSQDSSVRVVPAATPRSDQSEREVGPLPWEPGETVRVIRRGEQSPGPGPLADEVADDVARIKRSTREPGIDESPPVPVVESLPPSESPQEGTVEPEPEPEPAHHQEQATEETKPPMIETPPVSGARSDDIGSLFAALRDGGGVVAVEEPPAPTHTRHSGPEEPQHPEAAAPKPEPLPDVQSPGDRRGWIDEREIRLLPITNRALRGVKKSVTDMQNIALDALRTHDEWEPDGTELAETLRADLIGLWAESYSAGHAVAEEMLGRKLRRGDTPKSDASDGFGEDLAHALRQALASAGDGPRERQSAISRVFRGWRTDEAERRTRELAKRGYHLGLVDSVEGEATVAWVPSGIPCSACRRAAADPAASLPPVHTGCDCTVVATG